MVIMKLYLDTEEKEQVNLQILKEVPCIVRNMSDDEAIIKMVDSNMQREKILPSEKAFAYKMKLEAEKHQGKGQI